MDFFVGLIIGVVVVACFIVVISLARIETYCKYMEEHLESIYYLLQEYGDKIQKSDRD